MKTAVPKIILVIIPGRKKEKDFIFARRETKELRARGFVVEEYYFNTAINPKTFFSQLREVQELRNKLRPDIVHAHFGTITGFFGLLAKGDARYVVTFRGTDLNWSPHLSFLRNAFSKFFSYVAMFFADSAILVSPFLCRISHLINPRAVVIPTGVDTSQFYPRDEQECVQKLGWSPGGKHIFFNAGVDPRNKRLDLAEAVVRNLKELDPSFELHVMRGEVPPEDVPYWMNASKVVLMLSDHEGSPTVVQEAIACGTGVVSFDVGDTRLRLENLKNGFVVKRDISAVTEAVIAATKIGKAPDPEKIREISYATTMDSLVSVYKNLTR